jgi:hypothetical protein
MIKGSGDFVQVLCNFFRNTAAQQGPTWTRVEQIAREILTKPHGTLGLRGQSRRSPRLRVPLTMATKPVVDFRAWAGALYSASRQQLRHSLQSRAKRASAHDVLAKTCRTAWVNEASKDE